MLREAPGGPLGEDRARSLAAEAELGYTPSPSPGSPVQIDQIRKGIVERFNRTLLNEWAYARPCRSETERRAAFDTWLPTYNHHRGHTALGGLPPASRVTSLSGQST